MARLLLEALAGPPWGFFLTFKSLSDQEGSRERQRVSLGKNLAGSNASAFTCWWNDSRQGWQSVPTS